jgi:outer membrane protein assembly factor BamE (lipoprotein component of BamABCDE complex)
MKRALVAAAAIAIGVGVISASASYQPEIASSAGAVKAGKVQNQSIGEVVRIPMRVSLLHVGADTAEVDRVMGRPTITASFDAASADNRVLTYASEPVQTRVTINKGRVTDISLDFSGIDTALLPTHARMVKPKMLRGGVLALLGKPDRIEQWSTKGLELEQMLFVREDEPPFSVFIADGVVVHVEPGDKRPPDIARIVLPPTISDTSAATDLCIGMTPAAAAAVLGPLKVTATSSFKGQQVLYADYTARDGHSVVSVTFTGGVLTGFTVWPPPVAGAAGDTVDSFAVE